MSEIPSRIRQEVEERSEHRCELFSKAGGRCPRAADDAHHIRYRSRGGDHSATNLLHVCRFHHDLIHAQNAQLLHHGNDHFYQFDIGPRDAREFETWWFWPEQKDSLKPRAKRCHKALVQGRQIIDSTRYGLAIVCADVENLALYELHGYDTAVDYLMATLVCSESSARKMITGGHWLLANPHLKERLHDAAFNWWTFCNILAPLRQLPGPRADELVEEVIAMQNDDDEPMPAPAIVEAVREIVGAPRRKEWQATATVALSERSLTLTVHGKDTKARRIAYRKACGVLGDAITITDWKEREV